MEGGSTGIGKRQLITGYRAAASETGKARVSGVTCGETTHIGMLG